MTVKRHTLWLLLAMVASFAFSGVASADERAELKERFKERYPTLVALKRADKVGETHEGLAAVVEPRYADDSIGGDVAMTVSEFLSVENRDRRRLYQLLADETGATPQKVAERDAKRRFQSARPDEFLLPKGGDWVRKRDLDKR